jgi:serine/threonine-protein kinase RsbT
VPLQSRSIALESEHDIIIARGEVRTIAAQLGFRLLDQTRLATVTSEQGRPGLRLIFEDEGPGIPDLAAAMRDGFTTGRSLGKGLPGSKRLVDVFDIESEVGRGTRVTVVRWL